MSEQVFEKRIRGHILFSGLSDADWREALRFFEAREARFGKGERLNRPEEILPAFGLVLEGQIRVLMYDFDGQPIVMAQVEAGGTFGEALCFLKRKAWIVIEALEDSTVLWLKTASLEASPESMLAMTLRKRFISMMAQRLLAQNGRIQILSKTTLRAKIITFLSQLALREGDEFDIGFNRSELAQYLGADRSALSRELSAMQRDGLIRYTRNHFILLGQNRKLSD